MPSVRLIPDEKWRFVSNAACWQEGDAGSNAAGASDIPPWGGELFRQPVPEDRKAV